MMRIFAALAFALAAPAIAQVPPRTLPELKEEVQARADRHAYPVSELVPAEVREALANLKSLDRDEWAAAWSSIGPAAVPSARDTRRAPSSRKYCECSMLSRRTNCVLATGRRARKRCTFS